MNTCYKFPSSSCPPLSTIWRQLSQKSRGWSMKMFFSFTFLWTALKLQSTDGECGAWWNRAVLTRSRPKSGSSWCRDGARRLKLWPSWIVILKRKNQNLSAETVRLHFIDLVLNCGKEGRDRETVKLLAHYSVVDFQICFCIWKMIFCFLKMPISDTL